MRRAYNIFLILLCIVAALSFLPWLYSIAFPSETSDPFVAYSPISESFVVSTTGEDGSICLVDVDGNIVREGLSKNERDSLVPQMYFTQLIARNALPDTIDGKAIDVPTLKHTQWVFNSLPRDLNRYNAGVYPIMESRPKRVDLEDPVEVFTMDGDIRFISMKDNQTNQLRSVKFSNVLSDKGFVYPAISASADITARKAYDEGYLLIDSDHKIYHMKMQAGQPYLTLIETPEGVTPNHVFILENPDKELIGLFTDTQGDIFAIEREEYKPVKLPLEGVNPEKQRIVIMRNIFNWIIRITDKQGTSWVALDSDDYSLLGQYDNPKKETTAQEVARWIFPFRISFTDLDDCWAYPRISDFSWQATLIWLVIFAIIYFGFRPKRQARTNKSN